MTKPRFFQSILPSMPSAVPAQYTRAVSSYKWEGLAFMIARGIRAQKGNEEGQEGSGVEGEELKQKKG